MASLSGRVLRSREKFIALGLAAVDVLPVLLQPTVEPRWILDTEEDLDRSLSSPLVETVDEFPLWLRFLASTMITTTLVGLLCALDAMRSYRL